MVVYYIVGSNDYFLLEFVGIVKVIYIYYSKILGWCDIVYNVFVDKYG